MSDVVDRREALLDQLDSLHLNCIPVESESWSYRRYRDYLDELSVFDPQSASTLSLDLHRDSAMTSLCLPIAPVYDAKEVCRVVRYGPTFIDTLASTADRIVASKADNELIISADFQEYGVFTRAGLIGAVGVWFDYDGEGDGMTPDVFASIFPDYRTYVYATYSSTATEPRWRAFLETDYVMPRGQEKGASEAPSDLYWIVKARLMAILRASGWYAAKEMASAPPGGRCHGFDLLTLLPETKIYLPCVPVDPGAAMSIKLTEDRKPIPLYEWLESGFLDGEIAADLDRVPRRPPPAPVIDPSRPIAEQDGLAIMRGLLKQQRVAPPIQVRSREERIAESVAIWAATRKGDGHRAFFNFGYALARKGFTSYEVENLLREYAHAAHGTGAERLKQVPQIIAKLTRDGLFIEH